MERQMTEAVTLANEELAILCDIVAGWSVKHSENLTAIAFACRSAMAVICIIVG